MAKGRVHISEGVDTKVLRSAMHALNESCHADVLKFLGRVCVLSVQNLAFAYAHAEACRKASA